jgi:TrmH family RNA methyltransferase
MLSKATEKLILSLHTKKGRRSTGLCLVEGEKVIRMAGDLIETRFSERDSPRFQKLVTTEAPQTEAAIARIPRRALKSVLSKDVVVVLDGVQDPGNVGAILRLCLGFDAGIILIQTADPTSPKVVRSSAGTMFKVPWIELSAEDAVNAIKEDGRKIVRLEKKQGSEPMIKVGRKKPLFLVTGSEGKGITLSIDAPSIHIVHNAELESLNVGHAIAIALFHLYSTRE